MCYIAVIGSCLDDSHSCFSFYAWVYTKEGFPIIKSVMGHFLAFLPKWPFTKSHALAVVFIVSIPLLRERVTLLKVLYYTHVHCVVKRNLSNQDSLN